MQCVRDLVIREAYVLGLAIGRRQWLRKGLSLGVGNAVASAGEWARADEWAGACWHGRARVLARTLEDIRDEVAQGDGDTERRHAQYKGVERRVAR